MFERPYFLWLRRAELSITNQEFSLTLSRSDVNTCALLQRGCISLQGAGQVFGDNLGTDCHWSWTLSALSLHQLTQQKQRPGPYWHLCLTKKTSKQNQNNQAKKPRQSPGLTRPGTVRGYRVLLFILLRDNTAPWVQILLLGPRSPEGTEDSKLCWSLVSIISIKITKSPSNLLSLAVTTFLKRHYAEGRGRRYFSLSHCCEEKLLMGKCHWATTLRIWVRSASELTE